MARRRTIVAVFFLLIATQSFIALSPRPVLASTTSIQSSSFVPRTISSLMGFDSLYSSGLDGSGVSIAVIDTGINGYHPDLKHGIGSTSSFIAVNQSFVPGHDAIDQDGHGTFIAGMLIGNGDSSSGSTIGMVPDSRLWDLRVLDENGEGDSSWAENALDWIIARPQKPSIISMSFGSTTIMPSIESKIKQLWNDGVFIVVAAGNEGSNSYTIDSPGNVLDVMTVGACTTDGFLLAFSSQGPTTSTYYYKPDIVAFGEALTSLALSSGYTQGSGTSFSVPFITAGVALLEEATGGSRSPDEIKAAILDTCTNLGGYKYYMEGAGLPNFKNALALLEDPSWNGTAVLPKTIAMPLAGNPSSNKSIEQYMIKPTVILSKNTGTISLSVEGDSSGATSASLEEYDGAGDRQFIVKIYVSTLSPSFKGGNIFVHVMINGVVAVTINVQILSRASPSIMPTIIFGIVIIALAGLILFFAVAYRKGERAIAMTQCEIDGICIKGI